jgi:hypothetical protein
MVVKTSPGNGTPVSDSPLAPPLVLLTDPRGCAKSPLVRAPTARAPLVTSGIEPRSPSNSPHLSVQTDQDFQPSRHDAAPLSTRTPVGQSSGRSSSLLGLLKSAALERRPVAQQPSSTHAPPRRTPPITGRLRLNFFLRVAVWGKLNARAPTFAHAVRVKPSHRRSRARGRARGVPTRARGRGEAEVPPPEPEAEEKQRCPHQRQSRARGRAEAEQRQRCPHQSRGYRAHQSPLHGKSPLPWPTSIFPDGRFPKKN